MSAILASAPMTVVSEINRLAEERAVNRLGPGNERMYSGTDVAAVAGSAVFNVYLEKLFLTTLIPQLKGRLSAKATEALMEYVKTPAKRIIARGLAGMFGQPIVEAMQGGLEEVATKAGTKAELTGYGIAEAAVAEAIGSVVAAASIGTTAQAVAEVQLSKIEKFNLLKEAAQSGTQIKDPAIAASENEILSYIKKKYPDIVINPNIERELIVNEDGENEWILDQGFYEGETGDIVMSPKTIIADSDSMPDVKSRIDEIGGRHERFHQIMAEYRERGEVDEDPVRKFFNARQDKIMEWVADTPYSARYANALKSEDPAKVAAAELAITEEYINAMGEGDSGAINEIKLLLLNAAAELGVNVTPETEARLIMRKVFKANRERKSETRRIIPAVDELTRLQERNQAAWDATEEGATASENELLAASVKQPGGLQSKSRRDFMRNIGLAGAGIAIDPSMVLEPATEAASPPWGGWAEGAVESQFAPGAQAAAAEGTASLAGEVAGEVFDDFDVDDFSDIEEQDERLRQWVEDQKPKEERQVPQKWRELETVALQTLMEENRAEGNPIWRAQFKELESRQLEEETQVDAFASIARKDMSDAQVTTRNFNNFVAKRGRAAMKGDAGKLSLLDRLRKIAGAPATKLRGDDQAATTEEYIAFAKQIAAGDTKNVVKFLNEQEAILTGFKTDKDLLSIEERRQKYADRVGKDVKDLAPRRSGVPPYEKFISPKLAIDMAQQQFDEGKITAVQLKTIKGKVGEAQTTIKTTGKLKQVVTNALIAEGIEITGQELEYWSKQAEILGKKQVLADIEKQEVRPKQEVRDELDKIYKEIDKGDVEVTRVPALDDYLFKPETTVGRTVQSVGWIDKMEDPTWRADDEVEIEGEMHEGFQVDDGDLKASVVQKDTALMAGDEAVDNSNNRFIITGIERDGDGVVMVTARMQKVKGGAFQTIRVPANQLTPTGKSDTKRNTDFRTLNKEINNDKQIDKLSKREAEKLTSAWYEQDGTQIPDRWKRKLLQTMFGPTVDNELAAFVATMNKALGPKVMAADHSIELDEFFTPGVVKALIDGTAGAEATSRAAELLSETNLTFTWQAINNLKKTLRSPRSKLSQTERDARDNALNGWYELLDTNLETMDFVDAHTEALKQWIIQYGDVLPKGSVYSNELSRLSDVLGEGINVSNAAQVNKLYGPKTDLFAAYRDNLQTKGMLPTKDKVFVQQFENAVKSGLKLNASVVKKGETIDMPRVEAHFTSSTLYNFLSFAVGRVTFAVDAFNRESFLGGSNKGDIPAAAIIANMVYRNPAASGRPEGMETGTDMIQELSLRTGEFQSKLSHIFSQLTNNEGVINPEINAQIIDHLAGKDVAFKSKEVEAAAKELQTFMDDIYKYAKSRTGHLKDPLDLRGAGDTVLPRVWNTQYIATKKGKDAFLRTVADKFTDPEGKSIFDEIDITPEDLYTMVVNSGGFVQGDWRQNKQDQTTSTKEIEKGELIQEYLDSLTTEELVASGLVIDDLQAILPRFINKAVQRTEYSAIFGSKDEILRALIQDGVDQIKAHNAKVLGLGEEGGGKIIDEKQFKNKVFDMSNILRGKYGYESVDLSTRRGLQILSNVETIAKLPFVMFASVPELGTMASKGSSNPAYFAMELGMATAWAGYKAVNGVSKLLLNRHLPAMRKHSSQIGGLGIIRDIQLLREMGIADIHAMGDVASTRYVNPSFAPGGIKSGAKSGLGGRVPKGVRAVFNMQTFMQATMLTTLTEMQQFMALRNFQRHMGFRMDAVNKSKGKKIKGKRATNRLKQYKQDMLDYGLTEDMDLSTLEGEAAFKAATLRFVDQVITRPNDATTAKIFRNPLTAPLVLFKRFITTYGNTLLTSIGRNMADKVDNVERSKQMGKILVAGATMYGGVMFAEMMRAAIKGDLEDEDFDILPKDYKTFMHRVDRMGVLGAPGSLIANLTFPSKAWYGDTGTNRMVRELTGPLGSDMAATLDYLMSDKKQLRRLLGQISPTTRMLPSGPSTRNKKKRGTKLPAGGTF